MEIDPGAPWLKNGLRSDAAPASYVANTAEPAKPQMSIFRVVLTSGSGFFTDAYDLFVISLVIPIVEFIYFDSHKMGAWEKGALAGTSLLGTLFGQLFFGYLGDRLGRKRVFVTTAGIIIVASLGSAVLTFDTAYTKIVDLLIMWRLILGIGIGGDYPLAAVVSSEFSETKTRGRVVATVFAMQGFGILAAAFVMLISLVICGPTRLDLAWRLALGFGSLAAMISFYFRLRMHETPRFEHATHPEESGTELEGPDDENGLNATKPKVAKDVGQSVSASGEKELERAPSGREAISRWMELKACGWTLFATCITWLLLDVAFYSQNLFNPTVLEAIGLAGTSNPTTNEELYDTIFKTCVGQLLIAAFATVPGYWVTVFTIEVIGRRTIQLLGFGMMSVLFAVLAIAYHPLVSSALAGFVVIYALTFFFANWGPNSTTFVLPSELFPTNIRSTAHGISAASGKAGAIIAAYSFPSFEAHFGIAAALGAMCVCTILGGIITWLLIPETMGRSLESMENNVIELAAVHEHIDIQYPHSEYLRHEGSPRQSNTHS